MRYSSLVSKPSKSAPQDAESANAKWLIQGGFVRQEMAGVYSWLPLGLRVLSNIENIIREELDAIDGQEVLMPALQPKENWEKTGRWDEMDVLFKVPSQTHREYALGATHEEIVTPLVGSFVKSYKDLPVAVYQIQTKFRDELRAKSGVLRGREFGMKDLYSFHATQEDLEKYYEIVKEAYLRIFKRCGLDAKIVEASGGEFTKKYSHEFQAITPAGEDEIIACPGCAFAQNAEIATVKEGEECPNCATVLEKVTGIEIGNIFDLGTKFTDRFEVSFTDADGEQKPVLMGCYGIGTTRLVGAIVEAHHDEQGIQWPEKIAPFQIHLISIDGKTDEDKERVRTATQGLYDQLKKKGVTVLWDDREDVSPGEKFADADLLGMPWRIVVSPKTMDAGGIEMKARSEKEVSIVSQEEVMDRLS